MKTFSIKTLVVAAIAFAAHVAFAADSYLYWLVNQDSSSEESIQFNYATIRASDSESYLNWYVGSEAVDNHVYVSDYAGSETLGYGTGKVYTNLGDASDFSYLVELWNGADEKVGTATLLAADLASYIFSGTSEAGASAYGVSAFSAVPEPTSGLLTLLGLAGLALRRKRRA